MEKEKLRFSIWKLDGSGARWINSNLASGTPLNALLENVRKQKELMGDGVYFVCDSGSNPNGTTSYGPTNFAIKDGRIYKITSFDIKGDHEKLYDSNLDLEVNTEVIEI